jgi:hypothetical protein
MDLKKPAAPMAPIRAEAVRVAAHFLDPVGDRLQWNIPALRVSEGMYLS